MKQITTTCAIRMVPIFALMIIDVMNIVSVLTVKENYTLYGHGAFPNTIP